MSKSDQQKMNFTACRELRLMRQKTAALLMPYYLNQYITAEARTKNAARDAVEAADNLLAELDRTAPPEPEVSP